MNRRNLLKGAVTAPIITALNACSRERGERGPSEAQKPSPGTLKIILNGPFGVVLHSEKDYRITAYVPSDPEGEHELRFQGPTQVAGKETKGGKYPSYRFALSEAGLDIGHGQPRIDQGFYDFNFPHIGKFQLPADAFVAIELPRPDYITFTPPAEPFLFGGKITLQPLDHILEYKLSEPGRVRIKQGEKEISPLACSELLKQYQEYGSKMRMRDSRAEESQLKNMEEMLRNCSASDSCVLFGVGFDAEHATRTLMDHGITFFNDVLLPSFAPNVKKKLQPANCTPVIGDEGSRSEIVPAVFRYPVSQPHLLQVSSVLDCHVGGLLGTSP